MIARIAPLAILVAGACNAGTHLPPTDEALIVGAQRADGFIVTRLDGGSPSADRALAQSACGNLATVLGHAKVDGGYVCPSH